MNVRQCRWVTLYSIRFLTHRFLFSSSLPSHTQTNSVNRVAIIVTAVLFSLHLIVVIEDCTFNRPVTDTFCKSSFIWFLQRQNNRRRHVALQQVDYFLGEINFCSVLVRKVLFFIKIKLKNV